MDPFEQPSAAFQRQCREPLKPVAFPGEASAKAAMFILATLFLLFLLSIFLAGAAFGWWLHGT